MRPYNALSTPSGQQPVTAPPAPSPTDRQEVEWQFDAPDLPAVARWLAARATRGTGRSGASSGVSVAPGASVSLDDTYFDTDDWRVTRAGYTLRVRRVGDRTEATLKAMTAGEDGLRRRREISEPLTDTAPEALACAPGPVGERVRTLAGGRALRPLFTLRTRRRTYPITVNGADAGEVALDEAEVPVEHGEPLRLTRVEVEVAAEAVATVRGFVAELRAACGLQPAARSKFEAGLAAQGLALPPPPDLGATAIPPDITAGELAFAVLRRHFAAFLAHEPGTRLGDDPEELHDMRVAARRLRAALSLFRAVLPARAERVRRELAWIARHLGEVRDLDVQLDRLAAWATGTGGIEPAALDEVRNRLHGRRARARRRLLRALESRRYARLVQSLTDLLRGGPPRRLAAARAPATTVAPALLRRLYRKFRQAGDGLGETATAAAYHRARIRTKRLRYAVEAFADLYGPPARVYARRLADLQDLLGRHQDAQVAMASLRDALSAGGRRLPPETAFAMGRIAQRYADEAAALRRRFGEVYDGVTGKPWQRLRRALKQPASALEEAVG
jgi:triphosphatase